MKNFDKWWTQQCNKCDFKYEPYCSKGCNFDNERVAWKAALELVKKEVIRIDSNWDYNPRSVIDFIDGELE